MLTKLFGVQSMPINASTSLTSSIFNNNPVTTLTGVAVSVGTFVNSTIVTSANGSPGKTANASITVVAPPSVAKAFTPSTISVFDRHASLSFTITNPNATVALTGVALRDVFPDDLRLLYPNGLTGSCGAGVISTIDFDKGVVLTGGTLPAGGSCTFSVNVTAYAGTKNNLTDPVTSSNGGTGNQASATLTVLCSPLTIFPNQIQALTVGGPVPLGFTAAGTPLTPTFSLQSGTLPAGLSIRPADDAAPPEIPLQPGVFHFTVLAQDAAGCSGTRTYDLVVNRDPIAAFATGLYSTPPRVRTYQQRLYPGMLYDAFDAYAPVFGGGVRVAVGDINGDGVADIITAPGPSGGPDVRVFDGESHALIREFSAMPASYTGGLFVAAGDVDGDGLADIVIGAESGPPEVKVFSSATGALTRDFFAFNLTFQGGVRVAADDFDGDGYADIVVAEGPGGEPRVKVFSGSTGAPLLDFFAYAPAFTGGVFVAAGDVNGDGLADVITGPDAGGGPHVRVFNGASGAEISGFYAYAAEFAGGVRVAARANAFSGQADIITAPGPGGGPHVRFWFTPTGHELIGFYAYELSMSSGVFVGATVPLNRASIDVPASGASVGSAFTLGGWAFEESAPPNSTGVDTIHAWAFPPDGSAPTFLGVASLGDNRPDVAAVYGGRYVASGYHLDVSGLAPGNYYVVVYVHGAKSHTFNAWRIIFITVQ